MNLLIVRLINLTMSLERTRLDPNDKQIEGIDITIKVLSSNYPYISGWSFHKDYQNYSIVYIDLIINEDTLLKYHKKPYYFERENGIKYLYPSQVFGGDDTVSKMSNTMNVFYRQLPKEFQMFNVWEYVGLPYRKHDIDLVKLEIDELIIKKG